MASGRLSPDSAGDDRIERFEDARPAALDVIAVLLAFKSALGDGEQRLSISFVEGHHHGRVESMILPAITIVDSKTMRCGRSISVKRSSRG
jgi:hypothetical protein